MIQTYECIRCGKRDQKLRVKGMCQPCYMYYKNGGRGNPLPPKGEIRYDYRGYPICHICGRAYRKVLHHVYQTHGITAEEYKEHFGLNNTKGVIAPSTKHKLQKAIEFNYAKCVESNLLKGGQNTRYEIGSEGNTRKRREQYRKEAAKRARKNKNRRSAK